MVCWRVRYKQWYLSYSYIPMSIVIFLLAITLYYSVGKGCQSWILTVLSLYIYWLVAGNNVIFMAAGAIMVILCVNLLEKNRILIALVAPIVILLGGFVILRQNIVGIALPVGYSVLTFTSISLLIDQYRQPSHYGRIEMLSYLLFFPKLFAGPLERAHNFIPPVVRKFNKTNCYVGVKYLIFAAFCKFVVSDMIASTDLSGRGINLWMQILIYAIDFFFDFWAYTLMAIGIGKIFGYDLSINFSQPYYSTSFREFWHKWNITLGTWLRDYIYIPLGGNRLSAIKWSGTVLLVFIISGLWHGATLPFFIWGVCHASLLIVEKKFFTMKQSSPLLQVIYAVAVFMTTSILWQLFVAGSLEDVIQKCSCLFEYQPVCDKDVLKLLLCGVAYVTLTSKSVFSLVYDVLDNRNTIIAEVSMLAIMTSILILLNCPMSFDFYYFRF